MTAMMKVVLAALLATACSLVASAQDYSNEPYEFILAKLAAEDGRYDEALSRIDKVIDKNPDNSVLLFERAMILIDAGRIDRGETELRKVVTAHPEFYDAQRILGRVLFDRAAGDKARVEEALQHLQAAYKLNPDDIATGMAVSQLLLAGGKTADAEKVIATLLERMPDQRALNYNYAQVLTKLGRGDESRQYLERAVLVDPSFGPAVFQLVDMYQREGEWIKAAELLQPLINDDLMNLDLQRQQAYFYLRGGQPEKARAVFKTLVDNDPKDTRSRFYLAEALSDLEQYEASDQIYRGLLEKTPDDPDLIASFGLAQIGQKKYDEAAKTFRSLLAVKNLPDNLEVLAKTQLSFIELQKGNYTAALEGVKPIFIFRDKPNTQAINVGMEALRKEKKYAEAAALLQPLVDKFGGDPFVNARYIEMMVRTGQKEKAAQAASTAVKFGARNAISAAEAYIQAGEYQPALALLKTEAASKPEDIDLQFELASAYERSGDKKTAEAMFQDILTNHPDHAATLNYLGYMWAESGVNLDRAAEMLKKAVSEEPHNGAYIDSLGWVYYRQGKLELAEKYLTDATRLLPRDATVHEHLGDVFAKQGNLTRALDLYRVALKLEPESKDEAQLRSKIAEAEKQTAQR